MISDLISRADPTDPEVIEEFSRFTPEERETFFGCRQFLVEEGSVGPRTERDAAAAILQHRRLKNPSLSNRELERALRFYDVLSQEMEEVAAEKKSIANVLATRTRR